MPCISLIILLLQYVCSRKLYADVIKAIAEVARDTVNQGVGMDRMSHVHVPTVCLYEAKICVAIALTRLFTGYTTCMVPHY